MCSAPPWLVIMFIKTILHWSKLFTFPKKLKNNLESNYNFLGNRHFDDNNLLIFLADRQLETFVHLKQLLAFRDSDCFFNFGTECSTEQ